MDVVPGVFTALFDVNHVTRGTSRVNESAQASAASKSLSMLSSIVKTYCFANSQLLGRDTPLSPSGCRSSFEYFLSARQYIVMAKNVLSFITKS